MLEISLIVILWIFFAYTSYKIGQKLHIEKSYPWYIIPLWNFWILGKTSEIKIKDFYLLLIMLLILFLFSMSQLIILLIDIQTFSVMSIIRATADGSTSLLIANRLAGDIFYTFIALAIFITKFLTIAIFWGSVARKMGKEYTVYLVLSLVSIYLPPLLLAFEKIDKFITTNTLPNMFSSLSEDEQKTLKEESSTPKKRINRAISIPILLLILLGIYYTF